MLLPKYGPENDPDGPVSQTEALKLLHEMHQQAMEELGETQICTEDREIQQRFSYANGESNALWYAIDLVQRIVPDPSHTREALNRMAQRLEDEAQELRRRAKEVE